MGPPKKRSNAGGALKQQLFLTPLSVSSVVGDGKRALSPIGVALSSLCDNGGSAEGTGRGGIGIARLTESGLSARLELHSVRSAIMEGVQREPSDRRFSLLGFWAGAWVVYMGER